MKMNPFNEFKNILFYYLSVVLFANGSIVLIFVNLSEGFLVHIPYGTFSFFSSSCSTPFGFYILEAFPAGSFIALSGLRGSFSFFSI